MIGIIELLVAIVLAVVLALISIVGLVGAYRLYAPHGGPVANVTAQAPLVAFLRSQPASNRATPPRDLSVMALVLIGGGLFPTAERCTPTYGARTRNAQVRLEHHGRPRRN